MNKDKVVLLLEQLIVAVKDEPAEVSGRYLLLPDGWVHDKTTGKEWGRSSAVKLEGKGCEEFCKMHGGRVPSMEELAPLIDYNRLHPSINTSFFGDTKTDGWYFTETPHADYVDWMWCVKFDYGSVSYANRSSENYVRPVRDSR